MDNLILHGGGASLVVAVKLGAPPAILHWGPRLPDNVDNAGLDDILLQSRLPVVILLISKFCNLSRGKLPITLSNEIVPANSPNA